MLLFQLLDVEAGSRVLCNEKKKKCTLIVGLPPLCSPLHLTIHVISVSGNQTRV